MFFIHKKSLQARHRKYKLLFPSPPPAFLEIERLQPKVEQKETSPVAAAPFPPLSSRHTTFATSFAARLGIRSAGIARRTTDCSLFDFSSVTYYILDNQ